MENNYESVFFPLLSHLWTSFGSRIKELLTFRIRWFELKENYGYQNVIRNAPCTLKDALYHMNGSD